MTEGRLSAAEGDNDSIETGANDLRYKERWSHTVLDYVSVDLFRYVQFINREEEVMFGIDIQKVVYEKTVVFQKMTNSNSGTM